MVPHEAQQQRWRRRRKDGKLFAETRAEIVAGRGAAAGRRLARRPAPAGEVAAAEAADAAAALDLVAFACGITSDRAWLNNVLFSVRGLLGGSLRKAWVREQDLPKLEALLAPGIGMDAPTDPAPEVLSLLTGREASVYTLGDAMQRVLPALAECGGRQRRLEAGLQLLDDVSGGCLEGVWPGVQALSLMLAGCLLEGAAYRSHAEALAERLAATAASAGLDLAEVLQPGLLAALDELLGRLPSGRVAREAGEHGRYVQLAATCASAPGTEATFRHGVALVGPDGDVLATGANRKVRLGTGRHYQLHAELDALLQLPSPDCAAGARCYIVQLDDVGVGFPDAHPCQGGCRQGLQIARCAEALHTAGDFGPLVVKPVAPNPDVKSHSLEYVRRHGGVLGPVAGGKQ